MAQKVKLRVSEINDGTFPDLNRRWGYTSKDVNSDTVIEFTVNNLSGETLNKLFKHLLTEATRELPYGFLTIEQRLDKIKELLGIDTTGITLYNEFPERTLVREE